VLWLGPTTGWAAPLAAALGDRRLTLTATAVATPGPEPGRNPWAHRPDRHAALRWGALADDRRTLDEVPDLPAQFAGLVFVDVLGALPSASLRALLSQSAARLPAGAPWLVVDRNGRYLRAVLANLRADEAGRGEARGTWRTAEELRRFLEVEGLGIESAEALASGRGRLAGRVLGAGSTAARLVLRGRKA